MKQVTEEMNCQRHNAESCKRALEQKLKDQERDSQKVPLIIIRCSEKHNSLYLNALYIL